MTPTSHPTRAPWRRVSVAVAVVALASLGGCGDDPFAIRWTESPDTVLLYSLARPELNLTSGFNFNNRIPVRIEAPAATGTWDMAVDTRNGGIVLLPPGALGVTSRAGIAAVPGSSFEDVVEAPADTSLYVTKDAVPVALGTIYVVRTNQSLGAFGTRCVYYAKLEPLVADPVAGTLTFKFDSSPVCNDRRLIPPD